jgi:hypothetical protein
MSPSSPSTTAYLKSSQPPAIPILAVDLSTSPSSPSNNGIFEVPATLGDTHIIGGSFDISLSTDDGVSEVLTIPISVVKISTTVPLTTFSKPTRKRLMLKSLATYATTP